LTLFIALFTSSSESFVRLLYDNGGINPSQIIQISELTIYYSWAALAVFIYAIFGMSLLSSGASKKYALLGLIAQILGLITNMSLVKSMGIYIFPLSYFIAHFTIGLWMM
jgi:peptidoglycan biosynthesis protein MviN/MurJ (putative lipid II flippase)